MKNVRPPKDDNVTTKVANVLKEFGLSSSRVKSFMELWEQNRELTYLQGYNRGVEEGFKLVDKLQENIPMAEIVIEVK